jgi:hypothetical protein
MMLCDTHGEWQRTPRPAVVLDGLCLPTVRCDLDLGSRDIVQHDILYISLRRVLLEILWLLVLF